MEFPPFTMHNFQLKNKLLKLYAKKPSFKETYSRKKTRNVNSFYHRRAISLVDHYHSLLHSIYYYGLLQAILHTHTSTHTQNKLAMNGHLEFILFDETDY